MCKQPQDICCHIRWGVYRWQVTIYSSSTFVFILRKSSFQHLQVLRLEIRERRSSHRCELLYISTYLEISRLKSYLEKTYKDKLGKQLLGMKCELETSFPEQKHGYDCAGFVRWVHFTVGTYVRFHGSELLLFQAFGQRVAQTISPNSNRYLQFRYLQTISTNCVTNLLNRDLHAAVWSSKHSTPQMSCPTDGRARHRQQKGNWSSCWQ